MPTYTLGLDLGQKRDYSALVVSENLRCWIAGPRDHLETFEPKTGHAEEAYHVVHAQRWDRGTPYEVVAGDVATLTCTPQLRGQRTLLLFDRTGVGGVVAEFLWGLYTRGEMDLGCHPVGITFTAGFSNRGGGVGTCDPVAHKGDVIARMASLLNTGRLVLPPGLPAGDLLEKELRAYQIKQRHTGYVFTEAAKESDHDDLVTALALSVWCPNWMGEPRYLVDGEAR